MISLGVLLFLAFVLPTAHAQTDTVPNGTYGGEIHDSTGPIGGMELTFSPPPPSERRGNHFRAEWLSLELEVGGRHITPTIRAVRLRDDEIFFSFDLDGRVVKVAAVYVVNKLRGTLKVHEDGGEKEELTFELTLGSSMP